MTFSSLINLIIFILIIILCFFIAKTLLGIQKDKVYANERISNLKRLLNVEVSKSNEVVQEIMLLNQLYDSVFKRLFKITKEILSLQKFIFENRS